MMAVLSESLMYCTHGPLRMQALTAWLCFVQLLAQHAPQVSSTATKARIQSPLYTSDTLSFK
jgi:hypothetical protein